jgi:hypothetical protein
MEAYIKLSTKEYPRHIGDIEIDPAGMADYAPVEWIGPPQIDNRRQRMALGEPLLTDNVWKTTWNITQIPDSEEAAQVRAERNQRLSNCDWTKLADSPETNKAAWATYRQALRDVPAQAGFPWEVQWPTQPV